jgi:hypothetical protein
MVVNVCPAAVTPASPDAVWHVLTAVERFGEWQDARFISAEPPGSARRGQVIRLAAHGYGRDWPVSIDVVDVDPDRRWIDLTVHLPLGLVNREHVTLTQTEAGGTLVRFN